jgi:hypothetical protein
LINQPYAKAILPRFVGEIKPPRTQVDDVSSSLRISTVSLLMQFQQMISTLHNTDAIVYLRILPVDATSLLLTVDSSVPQKVFVSSVLSTLTATMTHTERQTYIDTLIQALYVSGYISAYLKDVIGVLAGAETWVVNMETQASTQYDGFGFNSFAFDGTRYLAAADDGIYELAGDDDAGTQIESTVQIPLTSFGTPNIKTVRNAWIGVTSAGQVILKADVDGMTGTYLANTGNTDMNNQRVDLGLGLRGTYWSFTLTDLTPMELESISFLPVPLSRRI